MIKGILRSFKEHFLTLKFLKFIAIGGINTCSGILFSYIFSLFIDANLAFIFGYVVGLCISYLLNSCFTFREPLSLGKFLKFIVSYIPNFIIQNVIVLVVFNILGLDKIIAYILAALVGLPVTFLLLKLFAFKKNDSNLL